MGASVGDSVGFIGDIVGKLLGSFEGCVAYMAMCGKGGEK